MATAVTYIYPTTIFNTTTMQWDQEQIMHWLLIVCISGLLLMNSQSYAQNLENIGQQKPVTVSGGVGLMSTGYAVRGITARRDPFIWIATGNLNIDLYGWSVPLSFSYTNNQGSFQQPFNRYGISPQYKWAKVYLGYHSLTYSSYTLNGHVFLGGGVALNPGKFRFQTMYGRFLKAVPFDSTERIARAPVYERRGMATKIGYETSHGTVDAILFYAADDPASLDNLPDSVLVFPAQNVALSLVAKKQLGKRLTWDGEWATSILTRDRQSPHLPGSSGVRSVGEWFMPIRQSTTQRYAWKTGLTLALGKGFLQGRYERVDPDYQTLGSYFFNNDLENITLGIGWQFWKDRLQVNAQGGVQNNNLDQSEISQTRRWVSNYSVNVRPADRWQFTTTYSNFTSFTNIRPQSDPFFTTEFDSLNFYQVNQNASLTSSYTFGDKERKSAITLSTTLQQADEVVQNQEGEDKTSYYYSSNASYRRSIVPLNLSISVGGNLYHSVLQEINTTTLGPLVSVSKSFLEKKLRSSLSTGFNQVLTNRVATSKVLTSRLSGGYTRQNHRFSLNLNVLNNFPTGEKGAFIEWTTVARYGYTF